jgi:hypothetical protein
MVMTAELTRLTHKIAVQLHQWQRAVPFAVLAPGGQFGNVWIHPGIVELKLYIFLISTLFGGKWIVSRSGHFSHGP